MVSVSDMVLLSSRSSINAFGVRMLRHHLRHLRHVVLRSVELCKQPSMQRFQAHQSHAHASPAFASITLSADQPGLQFRKSCCHIILVLQNQDCGPNCNHHLLRRLMGSSGLRLGVADLTLLASIALCESHSAV